MRCDGVRGVRVVNRVRPPFPSSLIPFSTFSLPLSLPLSLPPFLPLSLPLLILSLSLPPPLNPPISLPPSSPPSLPPSLPPSSREPTSLKCATRRSPLTGCGRLSSRPTSACPSACSWPSRGRASSTAREPTGT